MALRRFLFLLAIAVSNTIADANPFYNDSDFDEGKYGPYPTKPYQSTDLQSPRPNVLQWDRECDNGQYTLWTPRGVRVAEPGAMILDSKGDFVWWKGGYQQVYNMMAQDYNGERYLTFWAGDDAVGGHGAGYYYMVNTLKLQKPHQNLTKLNPSTG